MPWVGAQAVGKEVKKIIGAVKKTASEAKSDAKKAEAALDKKASQIHPLPM
jgi:hypothetical protein